MPVATAQKFIVLSLQAAIRLPDVHVRQKLDSLKMCVHAVPFPLQQQQLSHAVLL